MGSLAISSRSTRHQPAARKVRGVTSVVATHGEERTLLVLASEVHDRGPHPHDGNNWQHHAFPAWALTTSAKCPMNVPVLERTTGTAPVSSAARAVVVLETNAAEICRFADIAQRVCHVKVGVAQQKTAGRAKMRWIANHFIPPALQGRVRK